MEDVSYISYNSLIRRVNLYRQGIMPNSTIQEWYNGESTRPDCVILGDDETIVNPPDVDNHCLNLIGNVNALTPGRIYLIIMFSGQDFEQRYLYRGVSSSQHIPDGSEHSDTDSDSDSDSD